MKKIYFAAIMSLIVPVFAMAALRSVPELKPLQPMPEDTSANFKANTNTPGNEYNQTQSQVQDQISGKESIAGSNGEEPRTASVTRAVPEAKANLYVIIIIVCAVGLVTMLGWVYYRYRIKQT